MITGSLTYASALSSMGGGISGMFETMIVTILVASIAALMRANGGFAAILSFIRNKADSRRGGMFGIAFLTAFMDVATANNTVAIVIAAPIARDITEEYKVDEWDQTWSDMLNPFFTSLKARKFLVLSSSFRYE